MITRYVPLSVLTEEECAISYCALQNETVILCIPTPMAIVVVKIRWHNAFHMAPSLRPRLPNVRGATLGNQRCYPMLHSSHKLKKRNKKSTF